MLMEFKDPDTQAGMTERELLDEILTLVVAGHETTASTLNWTWWLVSQHPDVEQRLHEEQDRVGALGAGPTYADLERLPYTLAVLQGGAAPVSAGLAADATRDRPGQARRLRRAARARTCS